MTTPTRLSLAERWLSWVVREEAAHVLSPAQHREVARLMEEYVTGMAQLAGLPPLVAIFGSARTPSDAPAYLAAVETASLLAEAGFGILTGGGPGIMEAANRGGREGGTRSIGCPIHLERGEPANPYLDVTIPFTCFAPRKATLLSASAFVVFPGGFGTLDELFEVLVAIQTQQRACGPLILYDSAFWGGLVDFVRQTLVEVGTIDPADPDLLCLADDPQEIVRLIPTCCQDEGRPGQHAAWCHEAGAP
ncbi:MAG TPA: TIGR00730 family Rossman fold protein [Ktedonobacteraceae bacterium]|nr:TIGR00730 family Rossman fold protein [Ktedonobacteraceae bacterium]